MHFDCKVYFADKTLTVLEEIVNLFLWLITSKWLDEEDKHLETVFLLKGIIAGTGCSGS